MLVTVRSTYCANDSRRCPVLLRAGPKIGHVRARRRNAKLLSVAPAIAWSTPSIGAAHAPRWSLAPRRCEHGWVLARCAVQPADGRQDAGVFSDRFTDACAGARGEYGDIFSRERGPARAASFQPPRPAGDGVVPERLTGNQDGSRVGRRLRAMEIAE